MSITLKQVEAFYWAATLGTFSIAAERLYVTQSSLSKRIVELEAALGRRLFDRRGQRAVVTEDGERMLMRARAILELTEELSGDWNAGATLTGICRFGVSEQAATTWFPSFVNRLRAEHPDLVPKPQVGLGRSLERLVLRGELDFAVIAGPPALEGIADTPVGEVEFEWMASPRLLPRGSHLDAAIFEQQPIIVSTTDSGLNATFEHWVNTSRLRVAHPITCNSLTAIVGLTVAGQGISFLPRHYVQPLVRRKLLATLRSDYPFPNVRYSFVSRADDKRRLIASMRTLSLEEVDFRVPNTLWTV